MGRVLGAGATGFRLAIRHGHLVLLPTSGAEDPRLPPIAQGIDGADNVDLAVAFATESGVQLVEPWVRNPLAGGGRLRVVVPEHLPGSLGIM